MTPEKLAARCGHDTAPIRGSAEPQAAPKEAPAIPQGVVGIGQESLGGALYLPIR